MYVQYFVKRVPEAVNGAWPHVGPCMRSAALKKLLSIRFILPDLVQNRLVIHNRNPSRAVENPATAQSTKTRLAQRIEPLTPPSLARAARRRLLVTNRQYGNTCIRHYKNAEFEDAVDYYTMALHYCPEDEAHKKDRAVFLANRAQGHLRLEEVGSAAVRRERCFVSTHYC